MVRAKNPTIHVRHALVFRLRDVCLATEFAIEQENADEPNIIGLYCFVVDGWMDGELFGRNQGLQNLSFDKQECKMRMMTVWNNGKKVSIKSLQNEVMERDGPR